MSQHKMGYSCILLLVLIELRHKKPDPEVIKRFTCLTQLSVKVKIVINIKIANMK